MWPGDLGEQEILSRLCERVTVTTMRSVSFVGFLTADSTIERGMDAGAIRIDGVTVFFPYGSKRERDAAREKGEQLIAALTEMLADPAFQPPKTCAGCRYLNTRNTPETSCAGTPHDSKLYVCWRESPTKDLGFAWPGNPPPAACEHHER